MSMLKAFYSFISTLISLKAKRMRFNEIDRERERQKKNEVNLIPLKSIRSSEVACICVQINFHLKKSISKLQLLRSAFGWHKCHIHGFQ